MNFGLKTKIDLILFSSLLALGTVGTLTFSTLENRIVHNRIDMDVAKARLVVDRVVSQRAKDLTSQAELIADLPTLKSAMIVSHPDPATVHQRFLDYGKQLHADSFLITDDTGRMITSEGSLWGRADLPESFAGVRTAMASKAWNGVLVRKGQLVFGVSVPISVGGYVKGTISVFQRIDWQIAKDLAGELGTDVAFLQNNRILGSSIAVNRLELGANTVEIASRGHRFIGLASPFPGAADNEKISLVTLRDFDAMAAPFNETKRDMIVVLAILMGILILISRAISSKVIAQVESLISNARILHEGKWPAPIPIFRKDEIGLLQETFNDMSASLQENHELLVKKTEDLNVALVRAESATRAKTEFLSNVSHELRTPLNGIVGMTELLKETRLNNQQIEYVRTIAESNESLLGLINDVLSYSELESGCAAPHLEEFNLSKLIEETVSAHRSEAEAKGLVLSITVGKPCGGNYRSDSAKVGKLLSNLVSNAIKFTDSGYVNIEAQSSKGSVRIVVKDSGCGISPERQEEMFIPFHQADNSRVRRHGGTGLGLSICRQIATLLGGTVTVSSEVGKGSTFAFEFAPAPVKKVPEPSSATGSSPLVGLKVLIVEDNPVNLKVAAKVLAKAGANVECAESGAVALEMQPKGYDLILMDCHMPEMDGFECTVRIRELELGYGYRATVIALTASNLEEDRRRSALVGMDGYLVKPLRLPMIEQEYLSVTSPIAA